MTETTIDLDTIEALAKAAQASGEQTVALSVGGLLALIARVRKAERAAQEARRG